MSNEAINWALQQPVSKSSAKFVLVAMANLAGVEMTCWPSMQYLTNATSQDRKTVLEGTRRLREAGFIADTGERKGQTKSVVVYRLTDPKNGTASIAVESVEVADELHSSDAENGTAKQSQKRSSTENGAIPFLEVSSPVFPSKQSRFSLEAVPKTGHRTLIEPSRTPKEPSDKSSDDFADLLIGVEPQVLSDWKALRKQKKAVITRTALQGIAREATKAGVSMDDALRTCCARGWTGFNADWVGAKQALKNGGRHVGFDQRNYEGTNDGSIPA